MRSADIAHGALLNCGNAYVVKFRAGHNLLTAVAAVLQGNQFLGTGLEGEIPVLNKEER